MQKWHISRGNGQVLSVVMYDFRLWRKNPRIGITFSLAFILCFLLSDKVVRYAEHYDVTMQIFEPFIWTFSDSNSILLASLLLIFLFADMPFLSSGTPFFLMRTKRRSWLAGQAVYIVAATVLYMLFVLAATSVICMNRSFVGNMWSETAARLGYSGAGKRIAVPATIKTMEMSTPYQCMAVIFGLMLLYTLLLVFLMLVCTLYKGQIAGMVGAFSFSLYGFLLAPDTFKTILKLSEAESYKANVIVGWLSPLNQATFQRHNFGYDLLPTLGQTVGSFLILIAGCFCLALRLIRNYSFLFTGTEGGI
ncbi:MAG: hypothetical protein IJ801_04265 [Lachnospiraceae bacterium]|nr:hypothetical protein [Lachnospiraceae bacterium]